MTLNDRGAFNRSSENIYPRELSLSRTDRGSVEADYLDMFIDFKEDFYKIKLFDKRDNFTFKVINYPCMKYSNVPILPSYGIYLSQILRICRICTNIDNFKVAMQKLSQDFLNKGFEKGHLTKYFQKFIDVYEREWAKFGCLIVLPKPLLDQ